MRFSTKAAVVSGVLVLVALLIILFLTNKKPEQTMASPTPAVQLEDRGPALNARVDGSTLTLVKGSNTLELQACAENILRMDYQPQGKSDQDTLVMSGAKWEDINAKINLQANPATIETEKMTVKINTETFDTEVCDKAGKSIVKYIYPNGSTNDVVIQRPSGDNLYGVSGLGVNDSHSALLLRNGGGLVSAGAQGHTGAPLIWSTGGYGILVDSDGGSFTSDGDKLLFTGISKTDSEFFITLGSPKEIMQAVGEISGNPPMFPKWAMGFMNSEWGINENELLRTVDTYRSKNIPLDLYILDFDWKSWGQDDYGEWRWNTVNFPDGESGELKKTLDEKGVKLAGILKPRIHVDTVQGQYAKDNGFWLPQTEVRSDYFSQKPINDLNFALPDCRAWFWDHMKDAYNTGIIGYWNDEADMASLNFQFFNMQRALYEGQRSYTDQRVWSLNRNFYLGAQRYAYASWSGDIKTGFRSMQDQRSGLLSSINVGQMKWGMDTGGFTGKPSSENYARWMEFSAFTPVFRVHGTQNQQRQPWVYGEVAENAAAKAIRLRYSLIPYIYSYERQAYETGLGLVRPLIFDYPLDKNVENYVDAWMFGDYLLVSPVVDQAQIEKSIYLPEGEWIDYFKGTVYTGGQAIKYAVDSKTWADIPLFVKKGAIIPTQEVLNYVGEKPITKLSLDIFPNANKSSFNYYDDDGASYKYEKGEYFKQKIDARGDQNSVSIQFGKIDGSYKPELQYYMVKVHGISGTPTLNGQPVSSCNSLSGLEKLDGEGYTTGADIYGDVTYIKVKSGSEDGIEIKK